MAGPTLNMAKPGTIDIIDMRGKRIARLNISGTGFVKWNYTSKNVAKGIYFARFYYKDALSAGLKFYLK